jgi:hypothetical protein
VIAQQLHSAATTLSGRCCHCLGFCHAYAKCSPASAAHSAEPYICYRCVQITIILTPGQWRSRASHRTVHSSIPHPWAGAPQTSGWRSPAAHTCSTCNATEGATQEAVLMLLLLRRARQVWSPTLQVSPYAHN